jgi:hypothetical protein
MTTSRKSNVKNKVATATATAAAATPSGTGRSTRSRSHSHSHSQDSPPCSTRSPQQDESAHAGVSNDRSKSAGTPTTTNRTTATTARTPKTSNSSAEADAFTPMTSNRTAQTAVPSPSTAGCDHPGPDDAAIVRSISNDCTSVANDDEPKEKESSDSVYLEEAAVSLVLVSKRWCPPLFTVPWV